MTNSLSRTQTMTASDFKARCLDVLDRVADRSIERVIVTKRGRIVAVLVAPDDGAERPEQLFGRMRGSVTLPVGFDLTAPALDETLDAECGTLHR